MLVPEKQVAEQQLIFGQLRKLSESLYGSQKTIDSSDATETRSASISRTKRSCVDYRMEESDKSDRDDVPRRSKKLSRIEKLLQADTKRRKKLEKEKEKEESKPTVLKMEDLRHRLDLAEEMKKPKEIRHSKDAKKIVELRNVRRADYEKVKVHEFGGEEGDLYKTIVNVYYDLIQSETSSRKVYNTLIKSLEEYFRRQTWDDLILRYSGELLYKRLHCDVAWLADYYSSTEGYDALKMMEDYESRILIDFFVMYACKMHHSLICTRLSRNDIQQKLDFVINGGGLDYAKLFLDEVVCDCLGHLIPDEIAAIYREFNLDLPLDILEIISGGPVKPAKNSKNSPPDDSLKPSGRFSTFDYFGGIFDDDLDQPGPSNIKKNSATESGDLRLSASHSSAVPLPSDESNYSPEFDPEGYKQFLPSDDDSTNEKKRAKEKLPPEEQYELIGPILVRETPPHLMPKFHPLEEGYMELREHAVKENYRRRMETVQMRKHGKGLVEKLSKQFGITGVGMEESGSESSSSSTASKCIPQKEKKTIRERAPWLFQDPPENILDVVGPARKKRNPSSPSKKASASRVTSTKNLSPEVVQQQKVVPKKSKNPGKKSKSTLIPSTSCSAKDVAGTSNPSNVRLHGRTSKRRLAAKSRRKASPSEQSSSFSSSSKLNTSSSSAAVPSSSKFPAYSFRKSGSLSLTSNPVPKAFENKSSSQKRSPRPVVEDESDYVLNPEMLSKYTEKIKEFRNPGTSTDHEFVYYGRRTARQSLFDTKSTDQEANKEPQTKVQLKQVPKNRSGHAVVQRVRTDFSPVHLAHVLLNVHNPKPLEKYPIPKRGSKLRLQRFIHPESKSSQRKVEKIRQKKIQPRKAAQVKTVEKSESSAKEGIEKEKETEEK